MKTAYKLLALAAAALALYPFSSTRAADPSNAATHGIAVANMDRSVLPGNDFYDYANGSWIKRAVIPPDRARIGVFSQLGDLTNKRTAALIEEAAKSNAAAGSSERKIADLYKSYMNEATIESKGLAPLRPHLQAIAHQGQEGACARPGRFSAR